MTDQDTSPASSLQAAPKIRVDLQVIADIVNPGSRVLDIGCGDGELLYYLVRHKQVDGRGLEISHAGVSTCAAKGLAVVQGDCETDLTDYRSGIFDYVILSQTLQATHDPRYVLDELVRIGRRAIVSFPNFGYWRNRFHFMFRGRMPRTRGLPQPWYATPNIHFCTIRDFRDLCEEMGLVEEKVLVLDDTGSTGHTPTWFLANLIGEQAVFLLRRDR